MAERERYMPGVPCWIDTSQPDPEAAVSFYSGLFGWEFRDAMPPGSPGKYFIAQLRGGVDDVINVSGHRMSTMEIESAIVSHDRVAEAAVIGAADEE